ncbi:transketolase family protein [Halolactibacillus sp. JCM 19043]|uniref:transketolase family protein n=1 Tax=Halolactibacillus sp. JCM 19043 TaxID=1460638 RepID=UPI000780AD2F|nr:transketolase C-terminal domain-containing protein [Halolactibacillus sp. JCM 19043]
MNVYKEKDTVEMRQVYAETLLALATDDPTVVALEADLSSAITTTKIKDQLKDRYINVGIMEAEMIGAAAGLAVAGYKPFIHTFANFATRRVYDQVFLSLAYAKFDAVILGSDAGVTAEHNGGTHMPFEDLSLMRIIPGATVYEASDAVMLGALLRQGHKQPGLTYIRTIRKQATKLYDESETFETGSKQLREGKDAAILATGIMVAEALAAADELATLGIDVSVVDMYQLKPIDEQAVLKAAETGRIVTAENHNVIGGLGSAVAEVLAEKKPTKMTRIGVREKFGQVGTADWLKQEYGLTKTDIAGAVKELLS